MTPKKKQPSPSDLKAENQRLLEALEAREAELAVINSIQDGLASNLDIESIFELVGERIAEIFPGHAVALYTYDAETDLAEAKFMLERGVRHHPPPIQPGPLIKRNMETKKSMMVSTRAEFKALGAITVEGTAESLSGIYSPLVVHDIVIGGLNIENPEQEHAFTKADLRLVSTIASSLSVALENARLFDEVQKSNFEISEALEQQTATSEILHAMATSHADVQPVLNTVAENAARLFDAIDVQIYRVDGDLLRAAAHFGPSLSLKDGEALPLVPGLITARSVLERKTIHIHDLAEISASEYPESVKYKKRFQPTRSLIATPLMREGEAIGAIVVRRNEVKPFSEKQIALLSTFASQAAIAIENVRLFKETEQRVHELASINSVQVALASQLEMQAIYDAVGDTIHDVFPDAQVVDINTYEPATNLLHSHYVIEKGKRYDVEPWELRGFRKHIIETVQPLVINEDMEQIATEYDNIGVIVGEPVKSWLGVPMIVGDEAKGVISLQHVDMENAFSTSDVRLLQTLANSMSVALENARLFDETQHLLQETEQRASELAIINSVQEGLASKLDIQSIIELVGEKLGEIFEDIDALQINLYDEANNLVHIPYCLEKGHRHEHESREPWGFRKHVIESHQPLIINENHSETARKYGNPVLAGEKPKSVVFVPLMVADQVRGILSLQNMTRENAFPESTVQLLTTLANSMSVALENARLFDETQHLLQETEQRAAELATVNTVSQALVAESDLEALIELIGEQMRETFAADIVYVALLDRETEMIRFPYTYGEELNPLPLGEGLTGKIVETGEPLLINQEIDKRRAEMGVALVGKGARSYLGVPIQIGGQTFGVISVQSTREEGRFCQDDLHLLTTIAANVSTALRNAQLFDEIKRQKQYYEAVIENSPAAITLLDLEAAVTGWNPAAEKLFGYMETEALGRNIDDLVAKTDELHAEAVHYSQTAMKEKQLHILTKRTRKDSSIVEVEVSAVPVVVDGKNVAFIAIYHDVTELQRARQAAEEANQAKSTFLANMSHELRTPLNAIIGFSRIVRRKGKDVLPEKQVENLDKVLVSADHLLSLINTVLDISKIEAGRMDVKPADFELPPLIDLVVGTSQPLMQKGVKLKVDVQPDFPLLHSDQEKIKQILINLLSNAAKFTRKGEIILSARHDDDMLYVDVDDTGIGVSEDALGRIFEDFQQADSSTTREYGGTGLGLPISRSLARLLGGDLTASSIEGEGLTFTLALPMHYRDASPDEESTVVRQEEIQELTGQPVILSIDDDRNVHDLLKENLGERGYQVIGVCSGDEGIRLAREFSPLAIMLDILMPDKDGWQVLHELKSDPVTREIPVIMVTIVDKQSLGYQLGAADYLIKPLEEDAVLSALQRIHARDQGEAPIRLLVVDDDPNIPELVRHLLETAPYQIDAASDGANALEAIKRRPPDVILLDLMMPNMDGFTLIESLRAEEISIPIVVLTAKSLSADELEILEGNVEQIIQKNGLDQERLLSELGGTMDALRGRIAGG
ncbi:MAG: GAF domain-containing protein [Anaerolineales bacterium]|nr:MAG: GAF domain-containing protein [Anaerolineales bacterium]